MIARAHHLTRRKSGMRLLGARNSSHAHAAGAGKLSNGSGLARGQRNLRPAALHGRCGDKQGVSLRRAREDSAYFSPQLRNWLYARAAGDGGCPVLHPRWAARTALPLARIRKRAVSDASLRRVCGTRVNCRSRTTLVDVICARCARLHTAAGRDGRHAGGELRSCMALS